MRVFKDLDLVEHLASGIPRILRSYGKEFLDVKPNQSQFTPSKISDYQAMMDHINLLNISSSHALGIISSDESNM